jgi:hypothetical protein
MTGFQSNRPRCWPISTPTAASRLGAP